jgi:hypothetical protein
MVGDPGVYTVTKAGFRLNYENNETYDDYPEAEPSSQTYAKTLLLRMVQKQSNIGRC